MKIAIIVSLLFAAAVADKNIYMCGVTTTVPDSFDAEPTLLGNSPSNYNALSFSNFYATSGDVEGAAAIKGDLNLPNGQYSFGYELRTGGVTAVDKYIQYSLVVGGNANFPSGGIYEQGNNFPYAGATQYAYIAGSLSSSDAGIIAQSQVGRPNIDAQFDAVQAYYVKVQGVFAALPATIVPVFQYGGATVTCPSTSASLFVINIDGADLTGTTYWTKVGCDDKAQFVFNVIGSGDVTFHGASFVHDLNLVLWNVIGSGRTIRVEVGVSGSLLAPNNIYNQPHMGVWMGQIIVANVQEALQINRQFCPAPPAPQAPSTCVTFETECAGLHFNLGEADSFVQYNAVVFGDFNADTGDIEGRLAAKGDVNLGCGYSIGAALSTVNDMPDVHQDYSLIAGGDVAWCSGAIFPSTQGAVIERAAIVGNYSIPAEIAARVDQKSNTDAIFDAAQSCYCGYSSTLAAKAVNTKYTIQYTGLFITCDSNTDSEYVINISGAEFSQFTYYSLDNCNFQSRWTINIVGNDNVDISGDSFPAAPGGVVYNVIGSGRTVSVHDTQLSGHLLACQSTLNQPNGVIVGKVVVGSVQASKQINLMTTCPKPVSVQVTMVAANSAAAGSFFVNVLSVGSLRVGDVSNVGTITAINGNTVTLNKPLLQDVSAGSVVGRVYVSSTAGRGEVANTVDADSSSASALTVAVFAIVAALMI